MSKLIKDTFRRFFHCKTSIIILAISLVLVFFMIFVLPYLTVQGMKLAPNTNQEGQIADINKLIGDFLIYLLPVLILFTFPVYTSCLLIPIYIGNIEQNNIIFILTRNYNRNSLFFAKTITNAIFAFFYSSFTILALCLFGIVIKQQFSIANFMNRIIDLSLMVLFFTLAIQILVTTIAFFLQKKAIFYSILFALLFGLLTTIIILVCLNNLKIGDEKLLSHVCFIVIPGSMLLLTLSISFSLGLTKYKKINLRI